MKQKFIYDYPESMFRKRIDFDAAVNLMDNELREEIHNELAPCPDQKFITEYFRRHFKKFGEEFEVD